MSLTIQRLAITGMTCAGCVNALTHVLSGVPGVTDVYVSLETGRADVAGTAAPDVLAAAVRKAGYGVDVVPG
jgi:P-type Cu+ transporter